MGSAFGIDLVAPILRPEFGLVNGHLDSFGIELDEQLLSHEPGALRRQRDEFGRDPQPYFLILDEFQNFVSLDIANMLDQVRKFGLFLTLSHQRFGQL